MSNTNAQELEASFKKLTDVWGKQEELHQDLKPYLVEENGWTMLKHPLVFSVPHADPLNAFVNQQYQYKKQRIEQALQNKEWGTYVWMHERPYRFEAFANIHDKVDDETYWKTLGHIWTDSENLWQVQVLLDLFLRSKRPLREKMMEEDELSLLAELPDKFRVWRGHQKPNQKGYSWTLSFTKAKWFARRLQKNDGRISTALVNKKDVIAVLLGRNEYEVAVHPSNLIDLQLVKPVVRNLQMKHWRDLATSVFQLKTYSAHGPDHWEKVERNAIALCKETKGADPMVCRLFSYFHDCQRVNENDDNEHGKRAAVYLDSLKGQIELKPKQWEQLQYACEWHEHGKVSEDPTIGVCWDADRLDLVRVGTLPADELLSTEAAKRLKLLI